MADRSLPAPKAWLSWVLALIVVVAALAIGVVDDAPEPSPAERVAQVAASIRCPQCQGQSVAESNAAVARQIRADIRLRIDRGETDAQIQQSYIDQFDDPSIVLRPSGEGFVSLVWIIPVVAAGLGVVALTFAFAQWRGEAAALAELATDEDRDIVSELRSAGNSE